MTERAIPLTPRATASKSDAGRTWSMPARDVAALMNSMERLGYAVDGILASRGIRLTDLDDPDKRIDCEVLGDVLARAQQERHTRNLALALARITPIGTYPLLDYLVVTSDTVGDGVRQLGHYLRLIGNPVVINLHDRDDPVRVEMTSSAATFSVEFSAALMVLHFRHETDGHFAAANVCFQHMPDDPAEFQQVLGCPIEAAASWNGLSVPLAAWRLPLRRRDPVLQHMLESQANDILARLPTRTGLALQVQAALAARVAGGDTRIGALARQLGLSSRTLQRRLAVEGLSYQELLDEARKEAAAHCIRDSTLAIGEIAYLMGYSEPAPFHRAFKRWYGMTPDVFRRQQHSG